MTKDTTAGGVEAVTREMVEAAFEALPLAAKWHMWRSDMKEVITAALSASPAPAPAAGVEGLDATLRKSTAMRCSTSEGYPVSIYFADLAGAQTFNTFIAERCARLRALENGPASLADAHSKSDPHPEPVKEG